MPASALRASRHPETGHSAAALDDSTAWMSLLWDAAPAARRSRRVALLKRVLPAVGVALLLLVAMWPRLAPLWERMRFATIDLRDARELRMIHPRYAGIDRLGRPFVVTAAAGRQVPDRQDLMSLEAPRADLKTHSGADVVLTAATGIYQAQSQLLDLFGNVTLVHQNGTRFVTDRARINIANNTAAGSDPVVGHGPSGDAKGEGFRIARRGRCDHLHRQVRHAAAAGASGQRKNHAGGIAAAGRGGRRAGGSFGAAGGPSASRNPPRRSAAAGEGGGASSAGSSQARGPQAAVIRISDVPRAAVHRRCSGGGPRGIAARGGARPVGRAK